MSYNISDLFKRYPELIDIKQDILESFNLLKDTFERDGIMYVCGNGGSASDAEHMVGELMKSFLIPRPVSNSISQKFSSLFKEDSILCNKIQEGLRAISLNSHPSLTTAYANDVDAEMIFAQQLYVLGRKKDILVVFSTSGNSVNVVNALKVAKLKDIKTIALTGCAGGKCAELADCTIKAPSSETYVVQEFHLPVYHALCAMLEEYFYGETD